MVKNLHSRIQTLEISLEDSEYKVRENISEMLVYEELKSFKQKALKKEKKVQRKKRQMAERTDFKNIKVEKLKMKILALCLRCKMITITF